MHSKNIILNAGSDICVLEYFKLLEMFFTNIKYLAAQVFWLEQKTHTQPEKSEFLSFLLHTQTFTLETSSMSTTEKSILEF